MPDLTDLIRLRSHRRLQERKNPSGRYGLGCAGLISIMLAGAALFIAFGYSRATVDLPTVETIPSLLSPPDGILLQPTRIYDREAKVVLLELQNPAAADKKYLKLPDPNLPASDAFANPLIQTTLAATDPGFWKHPGATFAGLMPGGSPSIAQRIVSDTILVDEPASLRRKLREAILAVQLTHRFGREQVLEWYLNSANYGRLAYGADAAARLYLEKSASDLSLAEAALISGAAVDPLQNPFDTPQTALAMQKEVLLNVVSQRLEGWESAAQASQERVQLRTAEHPGQAMSLADLAPQADLAFLNLVIDQVETQIPRSRIYRGGLRIITSLDAALQSEVSCIARLQQDRLANVEAVNPAGEDCQGARLLPDLESGAALDNHSAQAVILDPQTGQVLAMHMGNQPDLETGSSGLILSEVEPALPTHPIAELGFPFIYLTTFTRGLSPASLVWNVPPAGQTESDADYSGPARLRMALVNDYLQPAEHLMGQVGRGTVWRTAGQFGLEAPQNPNEKTPAALSLFRPFDLLEIAHAYGALANAGVLAGHFSPLTPETSSAALPLEAVSFLRVEDLSGATWLDRTDAHTRPIVSSQLAYLVTHALSDEPARWKSLGHPNPLEIGRPAAAKLGTDPEGKGAWALGYTPDRVVAAWIGTELTPEQSPENALRLRDAAAGMYHAVMKTAVQELPAQSWPTPEGIVNLQVCDPGGMLPTPNCPNVVDEVFLAGNEPIQPERLFRSVQVNRETGRLATLFTPAEMIEELPYLSAPPEAAEWTQRMGMETPPDVYDTLTGAPIESPEAQISAPQMFSIVSGEVLITGTANGEDFLYYRLQVGSGLNPSSWLQIGDDQETPVRQGRLGVWDTRGLSGLYALELMVVAEDQSVSRSIVLVTVDNLPPVIQIVSPVDREEVQSSKRPEMVLLADVEDDLGIWQVEMFMDGILLAEFSQPPYSIYWKADAGEHTLRVTAVDQAGNQTATETAFTVR